MSYYSSPQMSAFTFVGVQLLPTSEFAYIQRTYTYDGIEIEEWEVTVKDLYGNTLGDITQCFDVIRNFNDPATGLPQVEWAIKPFLADYDPESDAKHPLDFGYRLIYLEINTGANGNIYSTPFMLTETRGKYATRIDYRNNSTHTMLSSSLQFFFRNKKSQQEKSNYTAVSTGTTFTATSKLAPFERWNTGVIEINLIEELKKVFTCRQVFTKNPNDVLPLRTGLMEAFDSPDPEMDENFAEAEVLLTRNYSLTYNPNAVDPDPGPPPVNIPFITLTKVESISDTQVKYYFTYGNFSPAPTYFAYEFSSDGEDWVSSASDIVSPHTLTVPNNQTDNFYYRIRHYGTGTVSNVMQLPAPSITITNITSPDGEFLTNGNKYFVFYTADGFSEPIFVNPNFPSAFKFQVSTDGENWIAANVISLTGGSPRNISTPSSLTEFTHFRIVYNDIVSNVKDFEF